LEILSTQIKKNSGFEVALLGTVVLHDKIPPENRGINAELEVRDSASVFAPDHLSPDLMFLWRELSVRLLTAFGGYNSVIPSGLKNCRRKH
jgi:hypothetical protein